ncbi:MAG TPA: PIN domain-containing protein [Chloroflexi bacterium]|jgi:predicted nucleic acid-binding protein|nr:PIN domain-containing protein [Chloroflexota bacterium]
MSGGALNDGEPVRLVLDTNVFVAAGFNRRSYSARIIERIRAGEWRLVWNRETRRETEAVLWQIPPLSSDVFADLFRPEDEFTGRADPAAYPFVADEADRKFAALAVAAGAVLISADDHLLSVRHRLSVPVRTPVEWWREQSLTE